MRLKHIFQIFFVFLYIQNTFAEIHIKITKGSEVLRSISVIPLCWKASYPIPENIENISNVIISDLSNSGKFDILSQNILPQQPKIISEIISDMWISLKIDFIIMEQLYPINSNNYMISYQLVGISKDNNIILSENKFKINEKWLRHAAHIISNEIFERLIGIKGDFCTRIAFIVRTFKKHSIYELWISDYDGYNAFPIYRSTEPLMSPSWSPDGNQLAYVTFINRHSVLIVHMLESGVIKQFINFPKHNGAPAFSPDGKKIAFSLSKTGSLNIYVMELISGKITQLTNNQYNNTEPSWFPDNQNLVYTSDQGGTPQIYKIKIDGSNSMRLSWKGYSNQNASVSSDGKFLILINRAYSQNIAKLDLITGNMKLLTNTFLDESPTISPNGSMIIYSTTQEFNSILKLISTNGKYHTNIKIIKDGQVRFPSWSPYM